MVSMTIFKHYKKHQMEYENFLRHKRVALVGPSKSALQEKNGSYIDSHDIVVRIKNAIPAINGQEEYLGSRTDVIYNVFSRGALSLSEFKLDNVLFICCPTPITRRLTPHFFKVFEKTNNGYSFYEKYKIRLMKEEVYKTLASQVKKKPNAGTGTIWDLLQFEINELYITGIDFFRSDYQKSYLKTHNIRLNNAEYIKSTLKGHDPDTQYLWFKQVYKKDSRIKLDDFMNRIVKNKKYDILFGQ